MSLETILNSFGYSSFVSFLRKKFWERRTIRWRLEVRIWDVLNPRTLFVKEMTNSFTTSFDRELM